MLNRKNAFMISNNRLYEGDIHLNCMKKGLGDMGIDGLENLSELELEDFLEYPIFGEIKTKDNEEYILIYDLDSYYTVQGFYNNKKICLYDCIDGIIDLEEVM